jgi:hypothetical protein
MARLTKRAENLLKRVPSEDLETLARELKKSEHPRTIACLFDAAKLLKELELEDDE